MPPTPYHGDRQFSTTDTHSHGAMCRRQGPCSRGLAPLSVTRIAPSALWSSGVCPAEPAMPCAAAPAPTQRLRLAARQGQRGRRREPEHQRGTLPRRTSRLPCLGVHHVTWGECCRERCRRALLHASPHRLQPVCVSRCAAVACFTSPPPLVRSLQLLLARCASAAPP